MMAKNNNIYRLDYVSERELHAYVDGLLDPQSRRKVEAYLDRNPETASEIKDYISYNDMLREAYGYISDEPVPQRLLDLFNVKQRNVWPAVTRVAAMIVLCIICAGGGWLTATQTQTKMATQQDNTVDRFLHQVALNVESLYDNAPVQRLEIDPGVQTDPLNWLTQKVALEMQAPDLTEAGYALERRRLVTRGGQEFVELTYLNQNRNTAKLYMKTRWDKQLPTVRFTEHNGKSIAHWQEGPLVYALTGALDHENATHIANLVRNAMTDIPKQAPRVQEVQVLSDTREEPATPAHVPSFANVPAASTPVLGEGQSSSVPVAIPHTINNVGY